MERVEELLARHGLTGPAVRVRTLIEGLPLKQSEGAQLHDPVPRGAVVG